MSSQFFEHKTTYDADTKIWSGIKKGLQYGFNDSAGVALLEALMRDPEHINQICCNNGKEYTNREIAAWSVSVAQYFKKLNMQQCDIIGLCASNTTYVAPLFFGAMLAGLTVSTLDPSFDVDGIKHIFSITKPKLMFCDGAVYDQVKDAMEQINLKATIFTMGDHKPGVRQITEFLHEPVDFTTYKPEPLKLGWKQTAIILCSSGTTGLPKGVCISHAHLLNITIIDLIPADRWLCFSTLYWGSGVIALVHGTLKGVTRIISNRSFSVEDFLNAIQTYKATVLFTPPSQMALAVASPQIKDYDLSSVTCYFCGGSAVPYTLTQKIQPYMPNAEIVKTYGMTEVCNAITMGISTPDGSNGQLVYNTEVKIVDDDGKLLGPCESGEICLRTLRDWAGYFANEKATKEVYSEDGWISSGDIGFIDNSGNLHIVDRKKEILKYNNFHFSPTEIEIVISEIPAVAEVCVCGIPDVVSTYLPAAAIVLTSGSKLTEQEVYEYVAKRMAHFKHLRGGVYFLDSLPKTASGKNLRRETAKQLEKLKKAKGGNTINI